MICPNCSEYTKFGHYVPPCLGEKGFYICDYPRIKMINPPTVGQTFTAKNGNTYTISAIFPPLTDEDGGVFRIVSIDYNAYLATGNQVVTNIRKRVDGTWEEVKTDIPGQTHPMASN